MVTLYFQNFICNGRATLQKSNFKWLLRFFASSIVVEFISKARTFTVIFLPTPNLYSYPSPSLKKFIFHLNMYIFSITHEIYNRTTSNTRIHVTVFLRGWKFEAGRFLVCLKNQYDENCQSCENRSKFEYHGKIERPSENLLLQFLLSFMPSAMVVVNSMASTLVSSSQIVNVRKDVYIVYPLTSLPLPYLFRRFVLTK